MNNLPYFFLLMKKNIILWTIITTGSFSKIDLTNTEHSFVAPSYLVLKNYVLSKQDTLRQVEVIADKMATTFIFETPYSKYQNNMHYYFGTDSPMGRIESSYEIDGEKVSSSTDAYSPIDIGIHKQVSVSVGRSNANAFKIVIRAYPEEEEKKLQMKVDSILKADSVKH
jgi:hypothetical protein